MAEPVSDSAVRALLKRRDLVVSVAVVTASAREARQRHHLGTAAASLFGQALAAAQVMATLQKNDSRLNLQLECDGPMRGLFVDASANGTVRGYVKNPLVDLELEGEFRWRAALGNKGFLSVLRDLGEGEYYRSSVELVSMSLAEDLNDYFVKSEQVATRLAIEVRRDAGEGLGAVAAVLIQALPSGDVPALEALGRSMGATLRQALEVQPAPTAAQLLGAFGFDDVELTVQTPVRWQCSCSHARAVDTVGALGATTVQEILDTAGSTAVTCQFCGTRHESPPMTSWGCSNGCTRLRRTSRVCGRGCVRLEGECPA